MFPSQVCDSSTQCQDGSDEWLHCHCYKMDMGHCEDSGDEVRCQTVNVADPFYKEGFTDIDNFNTFN